MDGHARFEAQLSWCCMGREGTAALLRGGHHVPLSYLSSIAYTYIIVYPVAIHSSSVKKRLRGDEAGRRLCRQMSFEPGWTWGEASAEEGLRVKGILGAPH